MTGESGRRVPYAHHRRRFVECRPRSIREDGSTRTRPPELVQERLQGEMDRECQLVTHGIYCGSPEGYQSAEAERLKAGVRDWMMLLQLDSDDDGPGWMWGDAGCLYYWIRKQDLAERRFDKIWTILQCY